MPVRFKITSPLMASPSNGKRVCRPTKWGNQMTVKEAGSNAAAVAWFEEHQAPELAAAARKELRGFDLGCYCDLDEPCHADVLLRLANS
jgi:hypothetical protein